MTKSSGLPATARTAALTNGITISDPSHPLAAGLSGNVSIYTGECAGSISRFNLYGGFIGHPDHRSQC